MEPGRRRKLRCRARAGLTFLEVVLASAILALVAAFVFAAFNHMISSQERQQRRLGAAELCNRLILQYLDDKETMPSPTLPVAYGGARYRWRLTEAPAHLTPARPDVAAERIGASSLTVDRIQLITVNVWLSEESGGSFVNDGTSPSYTITRLMDPISTSRNPDSFANLLANPQGKAFRDYMDRMASFDNGQRRGTKSGTPANRSPAQRQPPPRQPTGSESPK